jgi:hypothetical protein
LSPFGNTQDLDVYEWGHTAEADSITRQPRKEAQDEFVDWLFKSFDKSSKQDESVPDEATVEQRGIIFFPQVDESEIEYAPPQAQGNVP